MSVERQAGYGHHSPHWVHIYLFPASPTNKKHHGMKTVQAWKDVLWVRCCLLRCWVCVVMATSGFQLWFGTGSKLAIESSEFHRWEIRSIQRQHVSLCRRLTSVLLMWKPLTHLMMTLSTNLFNYLWRWGEASLQLLLASVSLCDFLNWSNPNQSNSIHQWVFQIWLKLLSWRFCKYRL